MQYLLALVALMTVACAAPFERRGPIVLDIDQEALGADLSRAAVDAADDWCGATGLALFAPYKGDGAPHVTVTIRDLTGNTVGFSEGHYDADAPMYGSVWVSPKLHADNASYRRGILVHELGHLLELVHTERAGDVMQANIPRDWAISTADRDGADQTPDVSQVETVSGIGAAKHSDVRCSDAWSL